MKKYSVLLQYLGSDEPSATWYGWAQALSVQHAIRLVQIGSYLADYEFGEIGERDFEEFDPEPLPPILVTEGYNYGLALPDEWF